MLGRIAWSSRSLFPDSKQNRFPGTVEAQAFASLGLVAPRPANSALASAYLEHIGIEPLPRLDDALTEWIGSASGSVPAADVG